MKKRITVAGMVSILMLLICTHSVSAGDSKTRELEQKIYEISSLQAKIDDKIDQAVEMQTRLEQQLADLREEVQSEQIRSGIYSHQEAMQNMRISNDLSLIQVLQAYIEILNERVVYFQNGNEYLKFLLYQIKDDMAIIHTLRDMEIDQLMDRIKRASDEFIPQTQKPVFNVADVRALAVEAVWDRVSISSRLN